jgi:hypothetical protein
MIDLNKLKHNPDITRSLYEIEREYNNTTPQLLYKGILINYINVAFLKDSICIKITHECCNGSVKLTIDNRCNYITNLKKTLKSLKQMNENEKTYKIFALRAFLPATANIPSEFICPITHAIMKKFFAEFSLLPSSIKTSVYFHLFQIQKPMNAGGEIQENAFYDRDGETSTIAEKTEAVQRCLLELQRKVIETHKALYFTSLSI